LPDIGFKLPGNKKSDVTDTPTDTQVLTFNSAKDLWDAQDSGAGCGEDNTSSNAGCGDGWALAKCGVDLPFKSLITSCPLATSVNANDLTLTIDNIPFTLLADGTDGELITWNACAAPAAVATGNCGDVLTSNGVGTAPTFQSFCGALPVADTTSIVEDPCDTSKEMRIDVGAVAACTVRVLTMPDANVDLGALTASNLAPCSVGTSEIAANGVDTAELAASAVETAKINNCAVTVCKIGNDAVTLAKMATGTDGNLISYDACTNPVAVATGTACQVLTSNGAGAAPTFQAAGGGGCGWTVKGKAADQTINCDGTLSDDTCLTFCAEANKNYSVEWRMIWTSDTTPDFKIAGSMPTNAAGRKSFTSDWNQGTVMTTTGFCGSRNYTAASTTITMNTGSGQVAVGACTGAIAIQWAQQTSSCVDTTLKAGSWLAFKKTN